MIGDIVVNRKGEPQLDKHGNQLYIGQSVLVMDTVHCKGGRASVSTGVVVGFDRYVVVITDSKLKVLSQGDVTHEIQFYEDKLDKSIKWERDYDEREKRGVAQSPEKTASQNLIGCSERFRRGWVDGSIFEG